MADQKKNIYFVSQSTLIMTENEHLDALKDIRHLMNRSNRFLSLSGLSGVFAGVYALMGAAVAWVWQNEYLVRFREIRSNIPIYKEEGYRQAFQSSMDYDALEALNTEFYIRFGILAIAVMGLSLGTGFIFSVRKAKKAGQKLLDHGAKLLLANLAIPLLAGGAFCLLLILRGEVLLVAPALLIFYGIALLAAGKYTLDEVRYLGICEVVLGLVNGFFFLGEGLLFWAIGFGLLHIFYGLLMWNKYDRKR
ncbi:MAG: hypothetical protein K0S33_27 [Bacteroidetes bacterium]|nr:hypothetical protein [Bacteroidota bacterium]